MDRILADIKHIFCMTFLNDVLIYSNALEDYLKHTEEVVSRITQAELTVNPNKAQMWRQSLKFLDHIVSRAELRPSANRVTEVIDFQIPQRVKELEAFLGLTGYYRTFIPRFLEVARPLIFPLKIAPSGAGQTLSKIYLTSSDASWPTMIWWHCQTLTGLSWSRRMPAL